MQFENCKHGCVNDKAKQKIGCLDLRSIFIQCLLEMRAPHVFGVAMVKHRSCITIAWQHHGWWLVWRVRMQVVSLCA